MKMTPEHLLHAVHRPAVHAAAAVLEPGDGRRRDPRGLGEVAQAQADRRAAELDLQRRQHGTLKTHSWC
jgi:hypothetical protein